MFVVEDTLREVTAYFEIQLQHRPRFSGLDMADDTILLADCFFELFIVIGAQARDNRKAIRSALAFAKVSLAYFVLSGPADGVVRHSPNQVHHSDHSHHLSMSLFYPLSYQLSYACPSDSCLM